MLRLIRNLSRKENTLHRNRQSPGQIQSLAE
jgi:hypothetical protein